MAGYKDPQDYEGGVGEMIGSKSDEYPDLTKMKQRRTTDVTLKGADGDSDAEMFQKFGYSQPITQISRLTQKASGYMRDGNLPGELEQSAIRQMNSLHQLLLKAECVNREERYDREERNAKRWMRIIESSRPMLEEKEDGKVDGEEDGDKELDREAVKAKESKAYDEVFEDHQDKWSMADAFMHQARIVEEQNGIEAAKHLYDDYKKNREIRDAVEFEATKMPAPYYQLFWCRIRQLRIMRERAYDLAMEYPIEDLAEIKSQLAEGKDIHDVAHEMLWPFQESYQLVMSSNLDGEAHRTTLMAMIAQQLPQQPQTPPWGYAPYGGQPPGPGEEGVDLDEQGKPDTRPAMLKVFGNNGKPAQDQQQAAPAKRRKRSRDR